MKKIIITFLLMIYVANAQEEQTTESYISAVIEEEKQNEIFDKRVSIYLHPLTIIGIFFTADNQNNKDIVLYATVEIPINSLIVRPSYWNGNNTSGWITGMVDIDRFGSDIGLRYYISKYKSSYIQGQMGLFSCSKEIYLGYYEGDKKENYMWFDVMGYIGCSKKYSNFSWFCGIGIGYSIKNSRKLPDENGYNYANCWIGDFNLGIGILLGNKKEKNKLKN